jgi:hypothetical protein
MASGKVLMHVLNLEDGELVSEEKSGHAMR